MYIQHDVIRSYSSLASKIFTLYCKLSFRSSSPQVITQTVLLSHNFNLLMLTDLLILVTGQYIFIRNQFYLHHFSPVHITIVYSALQLCSLPITKFLVCSIYWIIINRSCGNQPNRKHFFIYFITVHNIA